MFENRWEPRAHLDNAAELRDEREIERERASGTANETSRRPFVEREIVWIDEGEGVDDDDDDDDDRARVRNQVTRVASSW